MQDRPRVATLVSSLANYSATMDTPEDPDANPDGKATNKPTPKLGTLAGVYFPCMQNIFGVILFIRLTWVIGTAGVIQSFFIIFMCCSCVSLAFRLVPPLFGFGICCLATDRYRSNGRERRRWQWRTLLFGCISPSLSLPFWMHSNRSLRNCSNPTIADCNRHPLS
jgi:hypothetical protein